MTTKTKQADGGIEAGAEVKFSGYAEGGSGAFKKGEKLKVTAVLPAKKPDEVQYTVQNADGVKENLFSDEFDAGAAKAATPAKEAAPAKATAKKPAKTLAKPKQKQAPAKTGLKAPPKAKAAAKKAAKAAKAAKAPKEKTEEVIEPIKLTETVEAMVGTPKEALEAAQSLLANIGVSYYSLGGVLAYIQQTGAFKEAGYDTFRGYAEQELGQKPGKVYMLMDIYRSFSAAKISDDQVKTIGWTFARDMAKYITSENATDMFKQAKKMSREELGEWLVQTYASDAEKQKAAQKIVKQKYNFALHGDQAKQVEKAMKHAMKQLDTDDPNAAFFHIVTAYQQSQMQNSLTLEQEIEFIEKTHGVKLQKVAAEKAAPAKRKK
jgi:hypothetical protein